MTGWRSPDSPHLAAANINVRHAPAKARPAVPVLSPHGGTAPLQGATAGNRHTFSSSTSGGRIGSLAPGNHVVFPTAAEALPLPITYVTTFGAVGDGRTDSGPAIRRALSAAELTGGTLYFPSGHYLVSAPNTGGAISVHGGTLPLTLAGQGAGSTIVTGLTASAPVLAIRQDYTVVQDLTLDAQSHSLGDFVYLIANHATLQRSRLLGGPNFFDIYAAGDAGGGDGNQLLNDTVNDLTQMPLGDGISWSYQRNSLIENIDHTGSRLALYEDNTVTVQNYTYHPGPYTAVDQGFWVSAPSDGITITGFTTYGNGGVVSANNGASDTDVTINNEQFLGADGQLRVEGATGLTINGCNMGTSNSIEFAATIPLSGIVVENCTSLPMVRFWDTAPLEVAFNGDNFTLPSVASGGTTPTFVNYGRNGPSGPVTFAVTGGSWENQAGGFIAGGNLSYTVSGLAGYS